MRWQALAAVGRETTPLFIAAGITYLFVENSLLLTAIYLAMTGLLLFLRYRHGDLFAFLYGAVLGFAIEVFETNIVHIHTFAHPDFLGMPLWMPAVWGYGFLLMKRIGMILYEDARTSEKAVR